jgi:hypothetical protein
MNDNIISLKDYKRKKQEDELDGLADQVMDIIKDLDMHGCDPISQMYVTELDSIEGIGYLNLNNVYDKPTVKSCCSTLGWAAYMLSSLGEQEEADNVDRIITRLEDKLYRTKGGDK